MRILLLCEPRSGSTNLAHWFSENKDFTVLHEPLNSDSIHYMNNLPLDKWHFNTKHFLIKEIYLGIDGLVDLIKMSDKVVLLYRENYVEQFESWLSAARTNNWTNEWSNYGNRFKAYDREISYFKNMKDAFNQFSLDNPNYLKISYEELYFNDGLQILLNHLNIESLENKNFPHGKKYRTTHKTPRTLI
jgi:LPS sulfotransferase NodH